jgi:hypothetical protein
LPNKTIVRKSFSEWIIASDVFLGFIYLPLFLNLSTSHGMTSPTTPHSGHNFSAGDPTEEWATYALACIKSTSKVLSEQSAMRK